MKISLGAIPFYWPKAKVLDFYQQVKEWPIDTVLLGENVCSKRRELNLTDWINIGEMLGHSGKKVVLSSLALIEAESELKTLKNICSQERFLVEANDLGAVELLQQQNQNFIGGPFLNIYNPQTLEMLIADGLTQWVLPVELGQKELSEMMQAIRERQLPVATEVFVHGYLPLALSARCFTARTLDRAKDQCERVCIGYEQGIAVNSQEGQRLFTLNGIQTLSGQPLDLYDQIPVMKEMGVNTLRISPSQFHMTDIVMAYYEAVHHDVNPSHQFHGEFCRGYWFGQPGME